MSERLLFIYDIEENERKDLGELRMQSFVIKLGQYLLLVLSPCTVSYISKFATKEIWYRFENEYQNYPIKDVKTINNKIYIEFYTIEEKTIFQLAEM